MATKIDMALDSSNLGTSKVEEIAAKNIRTQLVKYVSPVLKSLRDPPDNIEEYKALYGSLGPVLQAGVVRARQQSGSKTAAAPGAGPGQTKEGKQPGPPGVLLPGAPLPPGTPANLGLGHGQQNRVFLVAPGQQGVRMAPGAQMAPGLLPGQMMTQQQQQQLQRQFSQQQNPFQ